MTWVAAFDEAMAMAEARFGGRDDASVRAKGDRDVVTATDYAIERGLREFLAEHTPEIGFLGEEDGHTGDRDQWWCLDPVDGTVNYSRGIPLCGISLALVRDGQPIAGAISLPFLGERYRCVPDGPATCNGVPVSASPVTGWDQAIVSVGDFATGAVGAGAVAENADRLTALGKLGATALRVRMIGTAAADLAWLTCGRLDAVLFHRNHPWDTAAGVALARAAGCVVTTVDDQPWQVDSPSMLARAGGLPPFMTL